MQIPVPKKPLIVLTAVVAVVGVALAIAVGVTSSVEVGCESCHLRDEFAAATAEGPHAGVECTACHGGSTLDSRLALGSAQVFGMYLRVSDVDPTVGSVDESQCRSCHDKLTEAVSESAGLRIAHATCAVDRTCTTCHSPTAHGRAVAWPRSATMEMCFDCHGSTAVPATCDLCHVERLPAERIKTGAFAVTHGPDAATTHGMADTSTCAPCHDASKCGKCHGAGLPHTPDFMTTHPEASVSPDAKCTSCHLPTFCSDCHGYEMPHTLDFKLNHAEAVEKDGEGACQRCHDPNDCVQCHTDHVHPTTIEQLERMGSDSGADGR